LVEKEQWYSNKELHEKITDLRDALKDLKSDLEITRVAVKKYNNLHAALNGVEVKVDIIEKKVNDAEQEAKVKGNIGRSIREWGGWIIAIVSLALMWYKVFGVKPL